MSADKQKGRVIFHIDMNSFYASVEMAYDPSLKGRPLAIAGNAKERKGIVVTCSYEARARGVKPPMPLWEAKRLCPELIVKPPNFDRYRSSSREMFQVLREYTDLVEPVSIDEGYMDLTDTPYTNRACETAKEIQERLQKELLLPSSIGIAPNKFLAKMASDMKKPLGITILRKREVPRILWPMDISEMYGVGRKTAEKLKTLEIEKIGDLAAADEYALKRLLGINGPRLKRRANGIDTGEVNPDRIYEFKSVGNSSTLPHDSTDEKELFGLIDKLSISVSDRLKRKEVMAAKVFIMIRFADWTNITRSKTLLNPTDSKDEIAKESKALFRQHWHGSPVRLLGVTGTDLVNRKEAVKQLDLFSFHEDAKDEPIQKVMAELNEKYGTDLIKKGVRIVKKESKTSGTSFNKDFFQDERQDQ
ncbi:DNA polymerase IV [Bacillus licheniformis]|uniref:DNA polymerase IV n=1 Tax=Bacillus licheniformis TaxID=1402 RepID=UPI000CA9EC95|nr:DNA polymerase IV [Bacillus licheniformis]MBU8562152.1 DNA polymerase IV [Bacillus licheniformis]MDE1363963.1 DNA polymerase IV [Bacillus licheniformis]MDE1435242.1 DNA polymerase IV [Bacillus licheniformis]MEC1242392.1 DNA polymerase IV [Bacillus licheniformis]MEC1324433.1 DNA polymerase IV [Bacillus licheniformis]